MERRKIQLIAGTTYSVSLPKPWVIKNHLKEKSEVIFYEMGDRKLVLSPDDIGSRSQKEIFLNIDEYPESVDQILFAVYYMGLESITLFSKGQISKESNSKIRKTLTHMSGTEISYEDKSKIIIKVLLDKSRVQILQVLYRVNLIIGSSILSMLNGMDIEEIRINEAEIDRLYHLITKIVSLSLIDSAILQSSGIKNVYLVPSFFLLSKKLENIADNIHYISEYISLKKIAIGIKEVLEFLKEELDRSILALLNPSTKVFKKPDNIRLKQIESEISKIKDEKIEGYTEDMLRYLIDIQEEVVNITFYIQLSKHNPL